MDPAGHVEAVDAPSPLRVADCERGIPAVFEEVVRRCPGSMALQAPEVSLTYDALNRRANQAAHALVAHGVKRGDTVALAAEAHSSLAIGMLGVLKAGGVVVFIDPKAPPSRRRDILSWSEARVVVSGESAPEEGSSPDDSGSGARWLTPGIADRFPDHNPEVPIDRGSLMALYFTSGTTGEPKAITRTHAQGIYEAHTFVSALHVRTSDRLFMPVSFAFGASTRYVLSAWLTGATLCPVSPDALGLDGMIRFAREVRASFWYSTPSLFSHLCRTVADERAPIGNIRAVILTGEAVRTQLLEEFRRFMGSDAGVLLNSLGSTECGAYCHLLVRPGDSFEGDFLPAGTPVEGKEVLILDEHRRPVASGETGEIAVRSTYLTPGYWKAPHLDCERFESDPECPERRTFYTGDLGFRDEQGRIHVVGRKDLQVKIRGYRVEPGDIEAALCRHPGVCNAAVLASVPPGARQILVAYLQQANPDTELKREDLDRHLLGCLPAYMIPSRYLRVEGFPLTERGKIDRKALVHSESRPLDPMIEPGVDTDPTVDGLKRLWVELLGGDPPDARAGFFERGGDSMLAMRLLVRIRERWDVSLPLAIFYESPTIASLARWITAGAVFGPDSRLSAMNEHAEGLPELYFMPGWMRNVLELQPLALALSGRFNCFGLELPPADDGPETIEGLATHCVRAIATRRHPAPVYVVGFSLGGLIAYETARQLSEGGVPIARVFILDATLTAVMPPAGLPRFVRFLRSLVTHPVPSLRWMAENFRVRIGHPMVNRLTGRRDPVVVPSALGPMPQRAAARTYVPARSNLRVMSLLSWERRLQIARPDDPWQAFTEEPVEWVQMPVNQHAQFVKEPNLAAVAATLASGRDAPPRPPDG